MKIRKSLTAVGAALLMVGVSAPVSAEPLFECSGPLGDYDKNVIAANLKVVAEDLRCVGVDTNNLGKWDKDPIWIKRGSADDGCEVHSSLARKLHEFRVFKNGSKPPKNDDKNLAAGASNDVAFEKYDAALIKLEAFLNDIGKAKINTGLPYAGLEKMHFVNRVDRAFACVSNLAP